MNVTDEQIEEIKRLSKANLTNRQISKMLNMPKSTLERYIKPVNLHINKTTLTPGELKRYKEGIAENYENINKLKKLLNSVNVGDQIEVTIKIHTGYDKARPGTYRTKVEQKTDHVLVVKLKDGRHISISDYELLTEEATIRKVS